MPVFTDFRYSIPMDPVQALICRDGGHILGFSKTCQLFMCVNPNKRAATNHVEYETNAWFSASGNSELIRSFSAKYIALVLFSSSP